VGGDGGRLADHCRAGVAAVGVSPDFGPAPLIGPDRIPTWNLVSLRLFEGLSLVLLLRLV
jgi:hypothetical protein